MKCNFSTRHIIIFRVFFTIWGIITANIYIGLTKTNLYTQYRVAWSDNRQTLLKIKYTIVLYKSSQDLQ